MQASISVLLRACLVGPTSSSMGYTPGHEHHLSKQPFRRRVGLSPTALAAQGAMQPTATSLAPLSLGRPFLSAAYRLPLALLAQQFSALADRVLPLSPILPHWLVDPPL